jgi:hypothetical protein
MNKKDQAADDNALDWLLNWAMGQHADARDHYFHIIDSEWASCGCSYQGEN